MLPLHSPRLLLRPFRDSDAETFAAYRSDPQVARYQNWEAAFSLADAQIFISELMEVQPGRPGEWYQLALELKDGGHMIGDCGFHLHLSDARQAEIGFTLAPAFQGQGYGSEAVRRLLDYLFADLKLHRVIAICDALNTASARLLERVGMRREGHFVENIWFKGGWGSEYSYAILRDEWAAHNPESRR